MSGRVALLFSVMSSVLSMHSGASAASALEAVVFIRAGVTDPITQSKRELSQGSGFVIDLHGHILTARHVIQAKEKEEPGPRWITVSLQGKDSFPVPAQLVACDTGDVDMCLIKVQEASVAAAHIGSPIKPVCRELGQTERITALGYPFGTDNPVISVPGDVTGTIGTELKYPSNVEIVPGMSGGPILDNKGEAVAMSAAGSTAFPTMTFLQPLFYGKPLIQRSGSTCESAAVPEPVGPVQRSDTKMTNNAQADGNPQSCRSRLQVINRTQTSENETSPTKKDYYDTINPDTNCRIIGVQPTIHSANNNSGPSVTIAPDGRAALVSYSLTSGPFWDRYRGWIDMELKIDQARE